MPVFVVGHGTLESGDAYTIVPVNTGITFWTDVDHDVFLVNGMRALETNDGAHGARYRYAAGQIVPNYVLGRLTTEQRARHETVASDAAVAWYVGDHLADPIRLCNEVETSFCGEAGHSCGGVLAELQGQEIVYLACRGQTGSDRPVQSAYADTGDDSFYQGWSLEVDRVVAMGEEAGGRWLCDLEDESVRTGSQTLQRQLAYYLDFPVLERMAYLYRARQFIESADGPTFLAWLESSPERQRQWTLQIPGARERMEAALLTTNPFED